MTGELDGVDRELLEDGWDLSMYAGAVHQELDAMEMQAEDIAKEEGIGHRLRLDELRGWIDMTRVAVLRLACPGRLDPLVGLAAKKVLELFRLQRESDEE